ncbi:MAG: dihydrolipoamide acetyltransferase family protein [Xanthobacteraceae bacterium]|jgi:pyruvate dehydrogenase E2 component (dihydrolipoyllysine-residue acetyltransferase)
MNILMPQLGETVAEGKITKWFKSAGDTVKPGENLFEIETDKTSMEVPATEAGILREIRVLEGEVAPVGAIVGVIGDAAGATASAPSGPAPATPAARAAIPPAEHRAPPPPKAPQQPIKLDPFFEVRTPNRNFGSARLPGGVTVTPLARRLAAEAGIDLSRLRGSGPRGRIVANDVENAPRPSPPQAPPVPIADGRTAEEIKALHDPGSYEEVTLDGMRRTIAARLLQAKQSVPHFYLTADIAIDRLKALRAEANEAAPKDRDGNPAFKLSLNDFIISALALALQRVPAANAVWAGDRILRFRHSDIGVAVAFDGGLIVPVIRSAETKTLGAISSEMKELAARAREKKLQPHEYQGGASAVSNLGMYGVREFTAIINPPHATILAVGAARRQAVEIADGGVAFVSMLTATLSCDHRVVDGVLGAELLAAVKALIEAPVTMLV